jgi:phenylpropionate dioxygenase-like ring-hydroxylating dioxygenase large terminal subunit
MEPIGSFDDQPVKTRLPRDAYLSRDYYDEEMERIFRPGWGP